jgi:hypothetical protein
MPSSEKIGRHFVRNRAEAAFTAPVPCTVEIFVAYYAQDNETPSTQVYWHTDKSLCSLHKGVPLPLATTVSVSLEKDESIFVITEDAALLGWSVTEWFEGGEE